MKAILEKIINEHELLTSSDYKIDIGIEVHVQLNTKSKIFCYCHNGPAEKPNLNMCQICTGQPGVLPVLNKEVINSAILLGLATNCQITKNSTFARKHYFYPELFMKYIKLPKLQN
jgi:aspartyl-tRNA(Asn)/glutamyl-tRNA(Gln) amidotransferase subunit B